MTALRNPRRKGSTPIEYLLDIEDCKATQMKCYVGIFHLSRFIDVMDYQIIKVSPEQLRFTQDSIAECFNYPRGKKFLLNDAFRDLQNGRLQASDFPQIAVTSDEDGMMWSNDNRRLYLFRKVGISKIKVKYYSRKLYRAPPERHLRELMGRKDYFPRVRRRNSRPSVSCASHQDFMPSEMSKISRVRNPSASEDAEPLRVSGEEKVCEIRVKKSPQTVYRAPYEPQYRGLFRAPQEQHYFPRTSWGNSLTSFSRTTLQDFMPSEISRNSRIKMQRRSSRIEAPPTSMQRSSSVIEETEPLAFLDGEKTFDLMMNAALAVMQENSTSSSKAEKEIEKVTTYHPTCEERHKAVLFENPHLPSAAEKEIENITQYPPVTKEAWPLAFSSGENAFEVRAKAALSAMQTTYLFTSEERHKAVPFENLYRPYTAEQESENLMPYPFKDEERHRAVSLALSDGKNVILSQEEKVVQQNSLLSDEKIKILSQDQEEIVQQNSFFSDGKNIILSQEEEVLPHNSFFSDGNNIFLSEREEVVSLNSFFSDGKNIISAQEDEVVSQNSFFSGAKEVISLQEKGVVSQISSFSEQARQPTLPPASSTNSSEKVRAGDIGKALAAMVRGFRKMFGGKGN
ncbi:hypothetical protein SUGI_0798190 [Cryptomeria japonica]|nr:hypothetical protein SUGI_0798190 [Cryptomeria japonica]